MKRTDASTELPPDLSESQWAALLNLLADDDPAVYQTVRQKILSYGPAVAVWLRPHFLSDEPALRRRAHEIVRIFERLEADNDFLGFCLHGADQFDLEAGAWLLALTRYPDLNPEAQSALLDQFAAEIREQLDAEAEPRQQLEIINAHFFGRLGFNGDRNNYLDPDNSYLNRVLDRRTGNPINLCLVYMLLARRLHLPITGIGMPGHFICRYQTSSESVYVDVFHGGKLLTKTHCVQYLIRGNFGVRDEFLAPVSPRRLLHRICSNLQQIYLDLKQPDEAVRLQRYAVALGR